MGRIVGSSFQEQQLMMQRSGLWVEVVGTGDTLIQAISADGGGMLHPTGVRISGAVTESSIKLVIGGVVAGDNKSTGAGFTTGIKTYGGATDLWGLTPTVAQINASNFGYAISLVGNGGTSKYLMVTNFGFTIPTGATINGVEVANDIENPAGAPRWDYIQIKVYYTEAPAVSETASTTIRDGSIHVRDGNLQIRN